MGQIFQCSTTSPEGANAFRTPNLRALLHHPKGPMLYYIPEGANVLLHHPKGPMLFEPLICVIYYITRRGQCYTTSPEGANVLLHHPKGQMLFEPLICVLYYITRR